RAQEALMILFCSAHAHDPHRLKSVLLEALELRQSIFGIQMTVLYIAGPSGDDVAVFLSTCQALEPLDRKLLEVFSSNIALGFDNLGLIDNVRALAFFDPLTHLPNRTQFQIEIETRLASMKSAALDGKLAVMLIDLDHFQMVNDGLGHVAGDDLLRLVAAELCQVFEGAGAVSRLSGDLFGILARVRGQEDEASLVELIGLCFSRSFSIKGNDLTVTVSGGYAVVNPGEADVGEAIRCAGMALKRAKRAGRGQIVRYGATMAEELRGRLILVSQLAEAKTGNQMCLYYQPQLRLTDNAVIGVEALLRWRRPDGVFIRPDVFIPAAEDSGHIVPLGEWVLRQACLKQVAWRQSGVGRLRVAVNVSVRQLRERGFCRAAERILIACNADPADIELEITESTAMESDRILCAVQELCDIGFRIAIDDFGTGHSSLARLSQLPVSMLKIDRAFVDGIDSRSTSRSIASMIVKMGHELGFSVLAEGVETETQRRILQDLACDYVQGYLYAKPVPADDLVTWLEGRTLAVD
ncbi:MAG: EAL domain-containing protein, partial [Rhodospirillaceae bacterium]